MSKTTYRALGAACGILLCAAPAMAAGEGGENNIFAGDVGNILWTLIIFGLVLFILGRYAWKPLLEILQQREDLIRNSLEEAKRDREEAKARLAEYEERLTAARAEARSAKDFAEADRVRDELAGMGITIKDGPKGTTWEIAR